MITLYDHIITTAISSYIPTQFLLKPQRCERMSEQNKYKGTFEMCGAVSSLLVRQTLICDQP